LGRILHFRLTLAIRCLANRQGLQDKAGKGKLVKVETLTKKDKLVGYEAKVLTNGKTSEVQVGTDGKALDHEE